MSLLSSFLVYFCFYPLPPSAPRLGNTAYSFSLSSTPSSSQLSQSPERTSRRAWGRSFLTAGLILTSPSGCFPGYQGSVESKIGSIVSNWAVHWDSSLLHTKKKALDMTFFRQTTLKSLYLTASPLSLLKALFEICRGNCSRACLVYLLAPGHLYQPFADS